MFIRGSINVSSNPYETFEWKISQRPRPRQQRQSGEPGGSRKPLRLGVLISGSGTNLQALIDAIESNELPGVEIALVVSNNIDAYGLERAHKHNLQTLYLHWKNREESETMLITWLNLFQVDLVVLAGWMRILSATFLAHFPNNVINIHPALLPNDGTGSTYITREWLAYPRLSRPARRQTSPRRRRTCHRQQRALRHAGGRCRAGHLPRRSGDPGRRYRREPARTAQGG